MKLFKVTGVAALSLAVLLVGCNKTTTNSNEINIGANLELSGAVASYGNGELEGAKLAIEEINANGGVLGKKLNLISYDNKSDSSEVVSIATKLGTKDKVSAIIGAATSGNTKAAIPAANKAGVPIVSPSATDDSVTSDLNGNVQPYAFRICFQDSFQGEVMAKFANKDLNAKTAAIISDSSSDYGKGLSKTFKDTFEGKIVAEESYVETDTDFSSIITRIKSKEFDVLFIPGYYGQAGLIIKAAREAGIEVPIIGADGFDAPELIELAGDKNLNKVYFSSHYSSLEENVKVTEFNDAFNKKYKKIPNTFNALSYDTVYLIADAITRANSDKPEDIKKALEETKSFEGVTGSVSINEKHNAVKSAIVVELKEGKQFGATVVKP